MTRFRIEKGISRINRVKLQASIEESVARDLTLMCDWSNNERNYVVNELLRFALGQDAEFQAYKAQTEIAQGIEVKSAAGPEAPISPSSNKSQTRPLEPGSGV